MSSDHDDAVLLRPGGVGTLSDELEHPSQCCYEADPEGWMFWAASIDEESVASGFSSFFHLFGTASCFAAGKRFLAFAQARHKARTSADTTVEFTAVLAAR